LALGVATEGCLAGPKILFPQGVDAQGRPASLQADIGWDVLNAIGWVFALVGVTDIGLIWHPFALANPDFLFGSVTSTMNGLPVLVLGLTFVTAYAAGFRLVQRLRFLGGLFLLVGVLILLAGFVFNRVAPIVLDSVDGLTLVAVKKSVFKTTVQLVAYAVVCGVVGVKAIRLAGAAASRPA
jgi:hypothetical protein